MTRKDLSELYIWIRKNNQHTPDDVIDFMYNAALEKLSDGNLSTTHDITTINNRREP